MVADYPVNLGLVKKVVSTSTLCDAKELEFTAAIYSGNEEIVERVRQEYLAAQEAYLDAMSENTRWGIKHYAP